MLGSKCVLLWWKCVYSVLSFKIEIYTVLSENLWASQCIHRLKFPVPQIIIIIVIEDDVQIIVVDILYLNGRNRWGRYSVFVVYSFSVSTSFRFGVRLPRDTLVALFFMLRIECQKSVVIAVLFSWKYDRSAFLLLHSPQGLGEAFCC